LHRCIVFVPPIGRGKRRKHVVSRNGFAHSFDKIVSQKDSGELLHVFKKEATQNRDPGIHCLLGIVYQEKRRTKKKHPKESTP
jgi:hypothetical protein